MNRKHLSLATTLVLGTGGLAFAGAADQPADSTADSQQPESTLATCPADINGDRMVDFHDLLIVLQDYGQTTDASADTDAPLRADIDNDGWVDFHDLMLVLDSYNQPCP